MSDEQLDDDEIIEGLLSDIPLSDVASVRIPSGPVVSLKPITFEEEKLLINSSKNKQDPLDILLSRCVISEELGDILFIDKIFLLYKLRQISFGNDYKFRLACPSCGTTDQFEAKIDQLDVVELESTEPVEIELPVCKKKVTVRRAAMSDEKYFRSGDSILDNVWRFVMSVEEHTSRKLISKFVPKLPAGDLNKIISTFMCKGYGLQTEVTIRCAHCDARNQVDLPLNKDFFTVS